MSSKAGIKSFAKYFLGGFSGVHLNYLLRKEVDKPVIYCDAIDQIAVNWNTDWDR